MGLEKLTNAFGILMMFQGLAAVVGGPIAGKTFTQTAVGTIKRNVFNYFVCLGSLYDATKNYDYSFYFAGILITLSALLCYPLNYVNAWEKRRALAKANNVKA